MNSSRFLKRTINILLIVIGVFVVLYIAVSAYAAKEMTKTGYEPKPYEPTPADLGISYMDVVFPARNDGLEIAGWYLQNEASDSAIIMVHGRHENRASAMEHTFPKLAAALYQAGFSVLMIDVRGHGQSAEANYDFGIKAKNDVLGAVDWLMAQGFEAGNIGAMGVSLGGGAVNFAAAEEPAIGAVVTDSTFTDMNPIIDALWQEETGLPNFFLPGVFLMHRIIFGFDLQDAVPVDAVREMAARPYLIIHCEIDDTVPFSQATELAQTIPNAETWYIPDGCEHAQIYTVMPEAYESHVVPFFEKNLK